MYPKTDTNWEPVYRSLIVAWNHLTNQSVFPLTWIIEQASNTNVTNLKECLKRGQASTVCVQSEATLKILARDEMFVKTENLQEYFAATARGQGIRIAVIGDSRRSKKREHATDEEIEDRQQSHVTSAAQRAPTQKSQGTSEQFQLYKMPALGQQSVRLQIGLSKRSHNDKDSSKDVHL
ncbi:hypothetical protein WH47_12635 [Habropoda laboriosa]|uniref:Uncharacterized protein n=1 Tax=Habropoda laboriosa TaxID=597456 RepID=A0A0L7R7I0_9HYME|nr:hypothetical protein WH47_12635 [Habropoda laboriosa]